MQKQQEQEQVQEQEHDNARLPAKKRRQSRDPPPPPATYSLPAKKRVRAFQPDFTPGELFSPFDLNVEYKPSVEEEKLSPVSVSIPSETQSVEEEEEEEEEDDDGILCAICQSTDGDPSDPIVFCDGCDLMVHCSCYGNPLIKGVPDGRWAHVVCALFVPEVFFKDPEGREGIEISMVPKRRWKDRCYLCKDRSGCAIDCSEPKCGLAFHVTCGLKEELSIEYREGKKKGAVVAGFCKDHSELWKKQQETGKFKIVPRED